MATSGSVDYNLNRNTLIREALGNVYVAISGEALAPEDIDEANRTLNIMLKAWQAYDLQLWKRDELTITLVSGQSSYTIGRSGTPDLTADRPLKVLLCERKDSSGNSANMTWDSREALFDQPYTADSVPTIYHYEPTLNNGTLRVWPAPDASAASEYTLELLVQSPIEDMDNAMDDFDCPQEWYEAIVLNLSYRLTRKYPINIMEKYELRKDARDALNLVLGWDREESVQFGVDTDGR